MIKYEAFADYAPLIEKIAVYSDRVIPKDNKHNRIAEALSKDGELQCLLDERPDCVHVGFVYSLPELYYYIIHNNGIKVPPHSIYSMLDYDNTANIAGEL